MKNTKYCLVILAIGLTGCATSSTYYNPNIRDAATLNTQRAIDEGYCTQVSNGSVQMPDVRIYNQNSGTYQINGNIRTSNIYGETTQGYYTGTVTNTPSFGDGLAQGVSNGIALGTMLRAKKDREIVKDGCMYKLGWTKDPNATPQKILSKSDNNTQSGNNNALSPVYTDSSEKWSDDISEFLFIYEGYRAQKDAFNALDNEVKSIANRSSNDVTGEEILLKAHDALTYQGITIPTTTDENKRLLSQTYRAAIYGDPQGIFGMASFYLGMNKDSASPMRKRGAYWAQKSYIYGEPNGTAIYCILLFRGIGINQDRIKAYKILKNIEGKSELSKRLIADFRTSMSDEELRVVAN